MAKKPVSLLHLHQLFRKVWDERDKSKDPDWDQSNNKEDDKEEEEVDIKKKGEEKQNKSEHGETKEFGPGAMLSHQDDIFHPDNLVQKSFHLCCQLNCYLKPCR